MHVQLLEFMVFLIIGELLIHKLIKNKLLLKFYLNLQYHKIYIINYLNNKIKIYKEKIMKILLMLFKHYQHN